MKCKECGMELKPHCNAKIEGDCTYCIKCHWKLFGHARIIKAMENYHIDPFPIKESYDCLRVI